MGIQVIQNQESNSQSEKKSYAQMQTGQLGAFQFQDNRSESAVIQNIKRDGDNNSNSKQLVQLKKLADARSESDYTTVQKKPNHTGLPDNLKSGVENMSGYSMDDVKVHYNSSQPLTLQAHAYAQGTDIHIAPGQEKHLPHEAWHVVQQKQGRVNATKQMKGSVPVNDDASLEKEADVMGTKALQTNEEEPAQLVETGADRGTAQLREIDMGGHGKLEIGDFAAGLDPDAPGYGGTTGLLGDTVATSMNMLVTPNHAQGSSPKDQNNLFAQLPTIGKYKYPANIGKDKSGSFIYIKGHLLNDNLGGPGTSQNLYPITHQANVDHDNLVEEPIKEWVNKHGGIVHYRVNVLPGAGGATNVRNEADNGNLSYVNAQFQISVDALTQAGAQPVVTNKLISSTWGNNPGNADEINFAGVPLAAPTFSAANVKLPPRVQIKKDWDEAYFKIAAHLALTTKVSVDTWLRTIDGIGPASVKVLKDNIDESTLSKSGKATLTKARGLLKQFIEEKYRVYLQVDSGSQSEEVDVDTGNTDPGTELISTNISKVDSTLDELDLLISQLKGFSLGPDDGAASSSDGGYQSSLYARGSYGKEVSAPPRQVPHDSLQGDAFIQFRDIYPADSGQDLETNCRNYILAVAPRVNPQKLSAFLNHAERVMRMQFVSIQLMSPEKWWPRFTQNVNTTALYYEANFPEGVFKI